MFVLIFLTVLLLEIISTDSIKAGDVCVTPYKEEAICVPVTDCDVITSAIATLNPQAFQFAQDSQCGCDTGMVCCGSINNGTYQPLTNCAPPLQEDKISLSYLSDQTTCGLDALAYRIKGGKVAKFEEFPWLAALEFESKFDNKSAGIRCGGSIIHKDYILTAAHCIVNVEFVVIRAWLGITNISSEENCLNITGNRICVNSLQKINVEERISHPAYMSVEGFHDIGLLRLEKSIVFSDYVRLICLPALDSLSPRIGTNMTVAGWGATENSTSSQIKLKVHLSVQNNNLCNEFLKMHDSKVSSNQLCVGGKNGKDSCQGDSGGPLMKDFINTNGEFQWYQEGIVSYGSGCGMEERPAVYIRVASYVEWIFDQINKVQLNLGKGDPCTTPSGNKGKCVPINTCQLIFQAASTKNRDGNYFAKKSYCGYDEEPLVCCQAPGPLIVPDFNSKALPDESTCGEVQEASAVVDRAELAELGEFPWVAAIEYKSKNNGTSLGIKCAGSLINKQYVLTTAACLVDDEYEPVSVSLGDWNITVDPDCKDFPTLECADPVLKIAIKETIPHVFYSIDNGQHDIGLILLEKDIKFTDYIKPICLPRPNLPSLQLGTGVTEIGWGLIENHNSILHQEEILIVSNEKCNGSERSISSQQLCAGDEKNQGTCRRGPLMRIYEDKDSGRTQWYQEGLPAYGVGCGIKGRAAIYTRVASYMDWIINVISK